MKPYSNKLTPPSTGVGIVCTNAVNFPKKPKTIAKQAAKAITPTDAFLVIPTTAVFSPYVVFDGPPKKPAANVAKPSPINVFSNPGFFNKSLSSIVLNALWSPICSAIVTKAIGAIVNAIKKSGL